MRWVRGPLFVILAIVMFCLSTYFTMGFLLRRGEDVVCPDLRGKTVEEARRLVEGRGLSMVISRYERRNDVPYNHITIQKPDANMPTRLGRVVTVIVSEGPPLVQVPLVVGQSLERAEELLKEKGLEVGSTISVPGQKAGRVVTQTPKGGENVLEGKGITLFMGIEESKYFLMPDVKNVDLTTLLSELEEKKIPFKVTYEMGTHKSPGEMVKTSVPSRMLFKAAGEIDIKVFSGGRYE